MKTEFSPFSAVHFLSLAVIMGMDFNMLFYIYNNIGIITIISSYHTALFKKNDSAQGEISFSQI